MKLLQSSLLVLAAISGAAAEDVLISERHLGKRFIDSEGNYNISFYHINDVHAHLDEFSSSGTDCTNPSRGCFGGYSRIKQVLGETRPGHNDSLLLNVGDEFQGTLFFNFYGGEKIAETLNQMGFDGMTIGNHEFDRGDDYLGEFLQNLTFPIISANIVSDNPVLNKTIVPYHIYEDYELAVIGVTTRDTPSISSPGKGTQFTDVIEAVQRTIDHIKSTTNITRIAAITHIGYEEDQKLAEATTGLQLIMGGHSHTPLGTMSNAQGAYPTIKTNLDGDEVFIVTAYRWGEYLGYIDVTYSPAGKILAYHGAPIHITNQTEQDPELQAQIDAWRGPFEVFGSEVVGFSEVVLQQSTCRTEECLLGQFMTDAMLVYRRNVSATADCAIINSGGIRATIEAGNITRGAVITAFPFGNSIVEIPMSGSDLWDTLEGVISKVNVFNGRPVTSTMQVSDGIKVSYNPNNANGTKLVSVLIGDSPLDKASTYNIVTLDFLAGGGDNIFKATTNFVSLDTQDEVLRMYVEAQSPIKAVLQQRIVAVNGTTSTTSTTSSTPTSSSTSTTTSATTTTTTTTTTSAATTTSATTTAKLVCNRDNCLRALVRSSSRAADFCATYTTAVITGAAAIPTYMANCQGLTSRVSSACTCLAAEPTPTLV